MTTAAAVPRHARDHGTWLWPALLCVAFVGIRVWGLNQVYFHDEYAWAVTVDRANWRLGHGAVSHPPLGELLYALVTWLVGGARLRLVPLTFSVVNLLLVYRLTHQLYGVAAARWAAVLFTLSVYSVIASLQIDLDGAIIQTFALLAFLAAVKLAASERRARWRLVLVVACGLGFLTKLTFGLVLLAIVADWLLETGVQRQVLGSILRVSVLSAAAALAIFVLGGFLVVLETLSALTIARPLDYAAEFLRDRFLNFATRDYAGMLVGLTKTLLLISPWGLLALLGLRDVRRYRLLALYLGVSLAFYLVAFDFSQRPLERYLMFALVPLAIMAGDVLAQRLRALSAREWRALAVAAVGGAALALALALLDHRILALEHAQTAPSKLTYLAETVRGRWDFLIVFTGGSGPLGFYVSALVIILAWLAALVAVAASSHARRGARWQRGAVAALLVVGAVYNAMFIEEYLGGLINGNASALTRRAVGRALASPEVRAVMTYNDAGAYELRGGGKYVTGFLLETGYEGPIPKRLELFRGHVLVVEMPPLARQSERWRYLSRQCRSQWELQSKRIPAHFFDCRDVLAGSPERSG